MTVFAVFIFKTKQKFSLYESEIECKKKNMPIWLEFKEKRDNEYTFSIIVWKIRISAQMIQQFNMSSTFNVVVHFRKNMRQIQHRRPR